MILGEVEEIYRTSSEVEKARHKGSKEDEKPIKDDDDEEDDDELMTCEIKRNFDMLFVRGDCVVLVSPPIRTSRTN